MRKWDLAYIMLTKYIKSLHTDRDNKFYFGRVHTLDLFKHTTNLFGVKNFFFK